MAIPQTLLIEDQTQINTVFRVNGAFERTAMEDFKLSVSIEAQKTFIGPGKGSKLQYQDDNDNLQTFSETFEKPLREWKVFTDLGVGPDLKTFNIHFDLVPASEVIKARLSVALLDALGKTVRVIEVEWIKSEIVVQVAPEFQEGKASLTLQSLKEDITDLDKVSLSLQSMQQHVSFLVNHTRKTSATLAELLPDIKFLPKGQETKPIEIYLDNNQNKDGLFNVFIFKQGRDKALDEQAVSTSSSGQHIVSIEKELADIKKIQEREQGGEQELDYLYQLEKVLQAEAKEVIDQLAIEEKALQADRKSMLQTLKEEKEKSLRGKTIKEQAAIRLAYQKQKTKILLAVMGQFLKSVTSIAKG